MRVYFAGVIFGAAIVAMAVVSVMQVQAQSRPLVWVREDCVLIGCVTDTLNKLSPERALEAKVIGINSDRACGAPYAVWFRR